VRRVRLAAMAACALIAAGAWVFARPAAEEQVMAQEHPPSGFEQLVRIPEELLNEITYTTDDEQPLGAQTVLPVGSAIPDEPYRLLYRTAVNLRLRTEPNAEAETIAVVPEGTMLHVTDTLDGEWYAVTVDEEAGYMAAEFLSFFARRPAGAPMYMAGSVTVMDAVSGEVLYDDAGHEPRYPASITKIMTALLVLENVQDLSQTLTFSPTAVDLPWYAGHISARAGDTMTVRDALYALMLVSGNEVANALAEHVSGSISGFTADMNTRAAQLGAQNTRFVNPCGLPGANQRTTAYDMALIMREAVQHPVFRAIIATPYGYLPPNESRETTRFMRNTNRLIQYDNPDYNPDVLGGKTGFTNDAQHTLVTYSEFDGRSVIVSVLYVPQRGAIFSDTNTLLEFIRPRL